MMAPYLGCSPKAVPLPKELQGKGERTAVFSREVALVRWFQIGRSRLKCCLVCLWPSGQLWAVGSAGSGRWVSGVSSARRWPPLSPLGVVRFDGT
jgi:hypothetical protein